MPVPTSIADISITPASNYPVGAEQIGLTLPSYLQTAQAILKQMVSSGTDIASANEITIPNDGSIFVVTGTTTIAGIAASWTGRVAILRFSGALQLTHNGSSFALPGSANITTAANDIAVMLHIGSGVWRCIGYTNMVVSAAEIGYLDGVTSGVQAQLDAKQATITGAATSIASSDLTASRALASSATGKVEVSAVTAAELGYVAGVTSALQTQLDAKAATITGAATTCVYDDLTTARALKSDSTGKIVVSTTSAAELGYVDGVTSPIQDQLDAKQATITGGATTITASNLTVSRALVSNGSGKVAVSATTSTELGYVGGVTSALQTQLDAKQATVTGGATTIVSSDLTASRALASDGSGKVVVSAVTATELGLLSGISKLPIQLANVETTGSADLVLSGIPSDATGFDLVFYALSPLTATQDIVLQFGTAPSTYISAGYNSSVAYISTAASADSLSGPESYGILGWSITTATKISGKITFRKLLAGSTNVWIGGGSNIRLPTGTYTSYYNNIILETTSTIDRLRIYGLSNNLQTGGYAYLVHY